MKTLLQVNSRLFADGGQSTRLASHFVARWRQANPETRLVVRDLAKEPLPHLDAARFAAFNTPPAQRTAVQAADVALSDALVAELQAADVLVIAVPFYNFGIPSTLKAWIDHVARRGATFRYTDKGAVGLLAGKRAYVFAARGGRYREGPLDTQTPYLRTILGFMGIAEVEFVYAEGLALGPEASQAVLARAHQEIDALVAASRGRSSRAA